VRYEKLLAATLDRHHYDYAPQLKREALFPTIHIFSERMA
jgi:hypothetical protein